MVLSHLLLGTRGQGKSCLPRLPSPLLLLPREEGGMADSSLPGAGRARTCPVLPASHLLPCRGHPSLELPPPHVPSSWAEPHSPLLHALPHRTLPSVGTAGRQPVATPLCPAQTVCPVPCESRQVDAWGVPLPDQGGCPSLGTPSKGRGIPETALRPLHPTHGFADVQSQPRPSGKAKLERVTAGLGGAGGTSCLAHVPLQGRWHLCGQEE